MARIKVPRKSTAIDMTAMCDVAFLLLTFFILTAKFKTEDPIHVDTPASTMKIPVPDDNLATITVGKGKVFFGVEGVDVRKLVLEEMGKKYNQSFTPDEIKRFQVTNEFGVPIAQLKQFLALDNDQVKNYQQPGIPIDTTNNNELYNWVYQARVADKVLHQKELRLSIKGDRKEEYPTIKMVIGAFQRQGANKFSLITSLRTATK